MAEQKNPLQAPDSFRVVGTPLVEQAMSSAKICFSSDILRRLGEELNPSVDKGILELVKNSYDADATQCRIELLNTDLPGGTICVIDNGDGMTVDEIENGWLVLGKSIKSQRKRTRLGRIPAGSKGLGRLASLRMGSQTMMTTRPKEVKTAEYNLLIDWSEFDTADLVDDVELTIEQAVQDKGKKSGTQILIENLRNSIGRIDVKRLARELILLADPFGDDPSAFKPELVAPEFADLEALVRNRYFRDAEYHLQARVSKNGRAHASVVDWKGAKIFSSTHDELAMSRKKRPYKCPPVTFDLWVFILNKVTFSTRESSLGEVRNWLQELGGVHLYHNGLRVIPYGNPGNDWLEMNLRRVQSPEERPGTNTSIGRVVITDRSDTLIQKTDRSGFIEGEAFLELKSFAQGALEWMASRRLEIAEKRRAKERASAPKKSSRTKKRVEDAIAKVPKAARENLEDAFESYESLRDHEVSQLHKEVQLYRTLSTAGITAATFAHESSANPIKVITQSAEAIERRGKSNLGSKYKKLLEKPVRGIIRAVKSLAVLGAVTLKLVDHEKRRLGRVELHGAINRDLETFEPFLDGRDVKVEPLLCTGTPYVRGSEAAMESIVTNLLNNSLAAFEDAGTANRVIRITTDVESDVWTMRVVDNGPGIKGISKRDIWLPGRTTRKNGTGLGLTIVRDAVKDLGGEVDAEERGDLGGAEIIVELPVLGM